MENMSWQTREPLTEYSNLERQPNIEAELAKVPTKWPGPILDAWI